MPEPVITAFGILKRAAAKARHDAFDNPVLHQNNNGCVL